MHRGLSAAGDTFFGLHLEVVGWASTRVPRVQVRSARRRSACPSSPCVPKALGHGEPGQGDGTHARPSKSSSGPSSAFHGRGSRRKCRPGCGLKISECWPGTVHCGLRLGVSISNRGPGDSRRAQESVLSAGLQGQVRGRHRWLAEYFIPALLYEASSSQSSRDTGGHSQNNKRAHTLSPHC